MRTVVAVLRGGPSKEYDVSLKTGASVLEALDKERYDARDIFIDRAGEWHLHGVSLPPEQALFGADVAFNAMHGEFGEDGQVQRIFERLKVPYTGSSALASAIAFDKQRTKDAVEQLGVKVAHGISLTRPASQEELDAMSHRLFRTFPHPAIVKPLTGTSSPGRMVARTFVEFERALELGFTAAPNILLEEYISGRDATVGVVDNFRNEDTYALIPIPHDILSPKEKEALVSIAKKVHQGLGLRHYSESDFVVSRRGIYYLETNTAPLLTGGSPISEGLSVVGAKLSDFIHHVLQLARKNK